MAPPPLDPRELRFLASVMRTRDGATFLDIGANAGFYSLFALLHAGNASRILAFEPHPVLFRRMVFNLRPLAGQSLRLLPMALGEREGLAMLAEGPNLGASRLVEGSGGIAVPVRRLTTVLAEEGIGQIDILKIDVEGYEDRVLQPLFEGASAAQLPRHMIIEHLWRHTWRYDCIEAAQALGFRVFFSTRSNVVLSRPG